jgi:SWI/SNF-related matrix-associated actin-dependent regulator of chromatin subfamily A member 5
MVVVPKSTLGNWMKEFARWLPSARVVKLHGSKVFFRVSPACRSGSFLLKFWSQEDRSDQMANHIVENKFDVCVTTYVVSSP